MKYETILYEKEKDIAILTFNRPEVLNASNDLMEMVEMPAAVEEAKNDDEVKVLIVTGAGRAFHAGDDIKQTFLAAGRNDWRAQRLRAEIKGQPKPAYFGGFYKPVIAAVNGPAVGGGLDIALSCDFRIASTNGKFGYFFVRRGIMGRAEPMMMLLHIVGVAKALEIMMTGELIEATEAERIGLVSKVVPPEQLMTEARALAARLTKNAPLSQQAIKRALHKAMYNPTAMSDMVYPIRILLNQTEDHIEGAKAFTEKRAPNYKGR